MPEEIWIEEYKEKAALEDPIAQTGRGSKFDAIEFFYVARQVLTLLDLRPDHALLDVGCSNGLLDILLSGVCREIVGIDPVEAQVELARSNLSDCPNVELHVAHGGDVPSIDARFDRVLIWNVIQLLPRRELASLFEELHRVTRPGGRILVGSVPDGAKREAFLSSYLEGVRKATHLTEERKEDIIRRNEAVHWYTEDELTDLWSRNGGRAERRPLPARDPNANERYHLILFTPDANDGSAHGQRSRSSAPEEGGE